MAVKTNGLFQLIKRAFRSEPALHPIEQKMAKRWIKQRLVAVFPELRKDAAALEQAYQPKNGIRNSHAKAQRRKEAGDTKGKPVKYCSPAG